ncbi:MAG: Hsp33 family molecular chaperone HslO, partial [Lachnospiraceae bacterium]|nr:Hsp33 family molecular chaperone HslO [Lachnospiraceae bacterium]
FSLGMTPEDMIGEALKGLPVRFLEKSETGFKCDCSRERIERSLIALPAEDVREMIDDGKPIEVRCQFCCKKYEFTTTELEGLLTAAHKG